MATVVIAGCGYVGSALARQLVARGDEVIAIRRSPQPAQPRWRTLAADLQDVAQLRRLLPAHVDGLVYAASPDGRSDDAYRAAYVTGLRATLAATDARRTLLVGSSGILPAARGWVDERTPVQRETFVARRLAEGEGLVRGVGGTVLRLGGIYGPGRERLLRNVAQGEARIPESPVFTNRIHRDDAAGILAHLLDLPRPSPIYFGVDHHPAEFGEVLRYLAERLGVPTPPNGPSSRRSNKRIRNAAIVRSGYRFRYPSYREGYEGAIRAYLSRQNAT